MNKTFQASDQFQFKLNSLLENYQSISLNGLNEGKLLNRFDTKYWVHRSDLINLLETVANDYFILDADGVRIQSYNNTYFDTPDNRLYLSHHNGMAGRIKIRKRSYVESGVCFLEIKKSTNKGWTIKRRIPTTNISANLTDEEKQFLNLNSGFDAEILNGAWSNEFNRITLVSRDLKNRCTIDFNIMFMFKDTTKTFDDLAIIEIKQERSHQKSKLALALHTSKSFPDGFSKYCIGRALLDRDVKSNLFKDKLLKLFRYFTNAA